MSKYNVTFTKTLKFVVALHFEDIASFKCCKEKGFCSSLKVSKIPTRFSLVFTENVLEIVFQSRLKITERLFAQGIPFFLN